MKEVQFREEWVKKVQFREEYTEEPWTRVSLLLTMQPSE